jgi:hypothetical protein
VARRAGIGVSEEDSKREKGREAKEKGGQKEGKEEWHLQVMEERDDSLMILAVVTREMR